MNKIVLKTDKRKTSVSRATVRSAVSGKFVVASSLNSKEKRSTKTDGSAKGKSNSHNAAR